MLPLPSRSRSLAALLVLMALYILHLLYRISTHDPTSLFFDPLTAYIPKYSALRAAQAEAFIAATETAAETNGNGNATSSKHSNNAHTTATETETDKNNKKKKKKLCLALPSTVRKNASYLRPALGSLLAGLSPHERSEIHIIAFIPHSNPSVHPAYTSHWLPALVDTVLDYAGVDNGTRAHIVAMEAEGGLFREKGLFDYVYVLRACAALQTPYIAVLEDDVLAVEGWYARAMGAVAEVERRSVEGYARGFLYLRLFYTEEFLGWNEEEWATYAGWSAVWVAFLPGMMGVLGWARPGARRVLSGRVVLGTVPVAFVCIFGFFALGRMTVLPLREDVHLMPKYGCCSQGFVFPREKAMELVAWFESKKFGFVDVLTEEYADENNELRWAVTPSVLQHVGRKSSKVDDYGPESKYGLSVAEKIWSFGFERYKGEELRAEHLRLSDGDKADGGYT